MLYLVLAILCSSGNSLILKLAGRKSNNSVSVLLVNYIVAVIMGTAFMRGELLDAFSKSDSNVFVLAGINGAIYVISFILMQFNIHRNGATVSGSLSHMGLAIPVILAILIFHEEPNTLHLIGVVVSMVALIVISIPNSDKKLSKYRWMLIPMVICSGIADSMSKFFEYYCNHELENVFLWMTFLGALILCFIFYKIKKEHINKSDVFFGIILGSVNYISTKFLIRAIYVVPAYMAYILYGLGVIVFINIVNMLIMHEKLGKRDYIGMLLAMIAIVILNL